MGIQLPIMQACENQPSEPLFQFIQWDFAYTKHKESNVRVYGYNNRDRPFVNMECRIGQLREICKLLAEAMPGHTFAIQPIFEGGIEFIDWPGREGPKGEMYGRKGQKYIRFSSSSDFPWISDKTQDSEVFYLNRGRFTNKVTFNLKAYDGAPPFTKNELEIFREVFKQVVLLDETPNNKWSLYKKLPNLET